MKRQGFFSLAPSPVKVLKCHTMAVRPEPMSHYWPLGILLQNVEETFLSAFLLAAVVDVVAVF